MSTKIVGVRVERELYDQLVAFSEQHKLSVSEAGRHLWRIALGIDVDESATREGIMRGFRHQREVMARSIYNARQEIGDIDDNS